jgi:hypothetical protein
LPLLRDLGGPQNGACDSSTPWKARSTEQDWQAQAYGKLGVRPTSSALCENIVTQLESRLSSSRLLSLKSNLKTTLNGQFSSLILTSFMTKKSTLQQLG